MTGPRRDHAPRPLGPKAVGGGGEVDCGSGAWAAVGCVPQGGASGPWLQMVQAALDCAYRAISKGWLTPEALLNPTGSLHAAALAARATIYAPGSFAGRSALISGGAGGIGRAVALELAQRGFDVTPVGSVAEAREQLKKLAPAFAVVDLSATLDPA